MKRERVKNLFELTRQLENYDCEIFHHNKYFYEFFLFSCARTRLVLCLQCCFHSVFIAWPHFHPFFLLLLHFVVLMRAMVLLTFCFQIEFKVAHFFRLHWPLTTFRCFYRKNEAWKGSTQSMKVRICFTKILLTFTHLDANSNITNIRKSTTEVEQTRVREFLAFLGIGLHAFCTKLMRYNLLHAFVYVCCAFHDWSHVNQIF